MHSAESRSAAAAVPLILMGERGHTVAGYMPAPEDLAAAAAPRRHRAGCCVRGPHLRVVRRRQARNRSGVVGVYESTRPDGRGRRYVYVQIGSRTCRFNVGTLGRAEAWRRGIALRAAHECKIAQANAAIVAARDAAEGGAA